MKRNAAIVSMILLICILLSGCGSWMDGSYVFVEPYREQNVRPEKEVIEVYSYNDLQTALVELVEVGVQEGIIAVSALNQDNIDYFINAAIRYVMEINAIGAYAVDAINYELGTNAGKAAIALDITYNCDRTEILRIEQVEDMEEASEVVTKALDECESGAVFLVENYRDLDYTQMIHEYAAENPHLIMETPQISFAVYPDSGVERIVELTFTYQTSREELLTMQDAVQPVFTSAELYVSTSTNSAEKYSQLYSFLMERYDYTYETSVTPPYSLLRYGVGDCEAFANVYAAMCRQAGLDCQVISGTRDDEAWSWNVICENGVYYHVDLLRCSQTDGFRMRSESEMSGYIWPTAAQDDQGNA